MHIMATTPGLSNYQDADVVVPLSERLAGTEDPESGPESEDMVAGYVRRILREKMVAMIMGADEEESGIPPLDYEL